MKNKKSYKVTDMRRVAGALERALSMTVCSERSLQSETVTSDWWFEKKLAI